MTAAAPQKGKTMRSYSDIARKREAEIQELKALAREALEELKAYHDDWNKELGVECVGIENCKAAQLIAKLSAALHGGE